MPGAATAAGTAPPVGVGAPTATAGPAAPTATAAAALGGAGVRPAVAALTDCPRRAAGQAGRAGHRAGRPAAAGARAVRVAGARTSVDTTPRCARPRPDGPSSGAASSAATTWLDTGAVALSKREREVALLAAQGMTSRAIAEQLFISSRTAENHLAKAYDKLGVRSRAELSRVLDGGTVALVVWRRGRRARPPRRPPPRGSGEVGLVEADPCGIHRLDPTSLPCS